MSLSNWLLQLLIKSVLAFTFTLFLIGFYTFFERPVSPETPTVFGLLGVVFITVSNFFTITRKTDGSLVGEEEMEKKEGRQLNEAQRLSARKPAKEEVSVPLVEKV